MEDNKYDFGNTSGQRICLLIVGPTNSGKTTAGKFIQWKLGWRHIEASSILRKILEERGEGMSADSVRDFMNETSRLGVAKRVISHISPDLQDHIVITGFRAPEEIEYFEHNYGSIELLEITASHSLRQRREFSYQQSCESIPFEKREELDEYLGLNELTSEYAEYSIENASTISDFQEELVSILRKMGDKNNPGGD
jgi:dephospho-CoA kinase